MDSYTTTTTIDRRSLANAIRVLAIDAVEAASSGHPGAPIGFVPEKIPSKINEVLVQP